MDFEDAKENIQPLAAGRNASILQAALHAESHLELQQQRRQYEDAIKNYEGDDPLEAWFEYIFWIEQSFPSGGKESGLEEVLLKCLTKFEKDERYHQDRRMIKLYIKYIDTHENPQECYQQLYNQGIGTMVADLYICWAYYYDLSGNFRKADQIFRKGIDCRAQPLEELQEAHQHFGFTMSQRILYDDDSSKQKYQSTLEEKRHALTSLKAHKKKVGSLRTGAAIKSHAPGKIHVNPNSSSRSGGNSNVRVFEDENQDPNATVPSEPAPDTSKSVVKTILDSARKQENVKEPGPWNKAHDKKKGKLFTSEARTDLGFEILEDEEDAQPIKGKINYGKPFVYFDGFVASNKPQEEWILPVTLENELMPRAYPSYDKCLLYPQPNMEFSLEELGCYYWCKKRNIENKFTKKYDMVWKSSLNTGIRMYPNFAKKSQLMPEEPKERSFDPLEANVSGKCKLVFDPKLCYPPNQKEELQFEEVIYQKWKSGERKLKYDGNETIAMLEEMEETICLPKEAARRKSFFPTRKSVAPSQFARLPPSLEESEEHEVPTTSISRRSVIMKTPKKATPDLPEPNDSIRESATAFREPIAQPPKLNFDIYEEEQEAASSLQVFNRSPKTTPEKEQLPKSSIIVTKTPKKAEPKVTLDIYEDDEEANESAFAFKTPAAPIVKQQKLNFQIYEEEENNYEANETCSTQVFNCFLKAQSVSTPKAPVKVMKPPTSERQPMSLNFSGIENAPLPMNPNPVTAFSPPEYNEAGLTLHGKQLSTIMETSEQTTGGNTASIKSSGSTPDFETEVQQSRLPLTNNVCTLETVQEAGSLAEKDSGELVLMKSLRLTEDTPTVRRQNEISRLEQREDTVPTMPTLKMFEDKTETVPKILFAKAGNFSRLEDREDTTPSIKPVRFHEDKTETITKMVIAPRKADVDKFCPDDEMLEFFAKSPEKGKAAMSIFTPPPATVANKSLFTASAFMNFQDSPEAKQKCIYDSPELRMKRSSLTGPKKASNLSFLPNFDEPMEVDRAEKKKDMQSSFLPNLSVNSGGKKQPETAEGSLIEQSMLGKSLRQQQSKEVSFFSGLQEPPQSKDLSFLPGFSKEPASRGALGRKNSAEDSFLLEFHNATIGASKPRENSFMPSLSNAGPLQAKKTMEDSFLKNFLSARGNDERLQGAEASLKSKANVGDSLMMFSSSVVEEEKSKNLCFKSPNEHSFMPTSAKTLNTEQGNMKDSLTTRSFKVPENSIFGNASLRSGGLGDSFMPNLSTHATPQAQKPTGDLPQSLTSSQKTDHATGESVRASRIPKFSKESTTDMSSSARESLRKSTKVSFLNQQKESPVEKEQKPISVSFLRQQKDDSFKLSFSTSPQQQSKISAKDPSVIKPIQKLTKPQAQARVSMQPPSQMNESQSRSTLSFLNTTQPKKQPDQEQKFAIFEDSTCAKPPQAHAPKQPTSEINQSQSSTLSFLSTADPRKQHDQEQKFAIFEDSTCQNTAASGKQPSQFTIFEDSAVQKAPVRQTNKNICFDVSCKSDEFFEDNIRTEAFATNLSMIKNSTWLPNHDPRQSHTSDQASNSGLNENSNGLSLFASIPKQTSVALMPPPPKTPVKVARKPLQAPVNPPPPPPLPANNCIEVAESDDEEPAEDLGKSIYTTKTPKTPKLLRHAWSPDEDPQTPEVNVFIHNEVDLDHTQQVIDDYCVSDDVNPFNRELMNAFLYQIDFTNYIEKLPTCDMVRRIKPIKKDCTIEISGKMFHVLKLVGEGSFGAVYCAKEPLTGKLFALKQERPANLWEYYICLELRSRLNTTEILAGFTNIEYALIGNNAGILVTEFSRYGSLITVCNKIKKETLKNLDEYVVMHMTSQLLLIMDHLHASNIIHGDVKPDNFLLMEKLVPGRKQPTIQLIDFGTSIDMDLFKKGQTFRYIHETESFKCVEMHENRPWTYQLDLFGLAGVIHVLLFGKYMEIVKKPGGWTHRTHVPRYFNKSLWETIFHSLLNIDNCQTMPNLQTLRAQLEEEIAEKDKAVYQKIVEFNRALDSGSGSVKF